MRWVSLLNAMCHKVYQMLKNYSHLNLTTTDAAAKSLQSCPTVQPHRQQPTRLPRPWDSPGKITGVGCHFLLQCMKVKSESEVAQSCLSLSTPWTAAYQAPLSMGFSRQEYWSGVPLPSLLSTAKRGILRDLTIIVDLSIYLCSSISFALCVLKLCLGT